MMDCVTCIYADIAKEPRTIVMGSVIIQQSAGALSCICPCIRHLKITDDGMLCSSYVAMKQDSANERKENKSWRR